MDKNPLIRKGLVVGIILIFIGITIAPSINFNVVKASNDNDLVEVTTQACGIKRFGNTTVKLTRQQYQNLEQYLVDFRARLNQTTTREEAVPIFNEAVVELNKYGLLPKGMSIEQAQTLVTGQYQNKNIMKLQDKLVYNHLKALASNSNYFCLIAGESMGSCFMHVIINNILWPIYNFSYKYKDNNEFFNRIYLAINNLYMLKFISAFFTFVPFIDIGTGIYFSRGGSGITSVGLLGKKSWTGDFTGGFQKVPAVPNIGFLGVIGFTGFHITKIAVFPHYDMIFFGSALGVKLKVYNP